MAVAAMTLVFPPLSVLLKSSHMDVVTQSGIMQKVCRYTHSYIAKEAADLRQVKAGWRESDLK